MVFRLIQLLNTQFHTYLSKVADPERSRCHSQERFPKRAHGQPRCLGMDSQQGGHGGLLHHSHPHDCHHHLLLGFIVWEEPLPLPLPGVKPNGERSAEDSAHHHLTRGGAEDQGHRRHQLPLRLHGGRQRLKDDFNEIRISWYATIDQKVVFRLINFYTDFTNNALIRFN